MSKIVKLYDNSLLTYTSGLNKTIYCEDPMVYTIDNILTEEECNSIIELAKPNLSRAMVGANTTNVNGTYSSNRTGKNCWFKHDSNTIFKKLARLIKQYTHYDTHVAEEFQVVHYNVGEEFKAHYDGWDQDGSTEHFHNFKYGGNRLATALIYLNNVEEGGGTKMTKLDKTIQPKAGRVLVFENCYKGTNNKHLLSMHAGLPVIRGEKYAINLWFKECPYSIMYSDFRPGYFEQFNNSLSQDIEEDIPLIEGENTYSNDKNKTVHDYKVHNYKNIFFYDKIYDDLSEITDKIKKYTVNKDRFVSWINKADILKYINTLETSLDVDSTYFENMYIVKYNNNHSNFFDAFANINKNNIKIYGQRLLTIVLCIKGNVSYNFEKLHSSYTLKKGNCLIYSNVINNSNVRDPDMIHNIEINEPECILANIYIREKHPNKNIINIDNLLTTKTTNNINNVLTNKNVSDIVDYYSIYNNMCDKLSKLKNITDFIDFKHDTFSFFLHSNLPDNTTYLDYIYTNITNYLSKRKNLPCVLNINNIENTILMNNNYIVINNIFVEEIYTFIQQYYNSYSFTEGSNYNFANCEFLSRMLQYEIIPIIYNLLNNININPTDTVVKLFNKNITTPEAYKNRYPYTVIYAINNDITLSIHKNESTNTHYEGAYYIPDNNYNSIEISKNSIILYKSNTCITKQYSKKDNLFIEMYFEE